MLVKIFVILMALAAIQCKPGNFTAINNEGSSIKSDGAPAVDDSDQADDVALEPVAIGGSYLACFIDRQIDPALLPESGANLTPIGCQSFGDIDYQQRKNNSTLTVTSAESEKFPKTRFAVNSIQNHSRWSWLLQIPNEGIGTKLYLRIKEGTTAPEVKMRVELLDILPSGLATAASLAEGRFLLRLKQNHKCISGNPIWAWDTVNSLPLTEQMTIVDCAQAVPFGFDVFETGFRMFTANPSPYSCDTLNFAVEHCQHSCMDLEDYGRGTRVNLFACTKSVEAQRHNFVPMAVGAFRLRTNGRFLDEDDDKVVVTADSDLVLELVPVPK